MPSGKRLWEQSGLGFLVDDVLAHDRFALLDFELVGSTSEEDRGGKW